jgi:hypothetical protein
VQVTANFAKGVAVTHTVTVGVFLGGSVTGEPGGIACPSKCSASYASGTVVTLRALPQNGKRFLGWSGGGCRGTGACTLTLRANVSVRARFSR